MEMYFKSTLLLSLQRNLVIFIMINVISTTLLELFISSKACSSILMHILQALFWHSESKLPFSFFSPTHYFLFSFSYLSMCFLFFVVLCSFITLFRMPSNEEEHFLLCSQPYGNHRFLWYFTNWANSLYFQVSESAYKIQVLNFNN